MFPEAFFSKRPLQSMEKHRLINNHFVHHDSFYMLPETIEKGNQLQFVASTGNQQSRTVPSSNLSLSSPSCAAYSIANQTQQPKALNASHMFLPKPKLHDARPW